jgi:hypothetical protein
MPLVQESIVNANYQALGMDEVARDISNIITAVNALEGGSDYTETIVNINNAQLLAIGVTPIACLPLSGSGKYRDYDYIIVEYYATGNEVVSPAFKFTDGIQTVATFYPIGVENTANLIKTFYLYVDTTNFVLSDLQRYANTNLSITTMSGANPDASVEGTMKIKIYSKTITFGA